MKYSFFVLLIIISLLSCKDDPEFFRPKFYPAKIEDGLWKQDEIFKKEPISIRLESRLDFDDSDSGVEGEFEPINFEQTILTADSDILYNSDTIQQGSNLLDYDFVKIETYQVSRNSNMVDDSYIIWINENDVDEFYELNSRFFTFYIESNTENGYSINDSTVVWIQD